MSGKSAEIVLFPRSRARSFFNSLREIAYISFLMLILPIMAVAAAVDLLRNIQGPNDSKWE
jgi:hypothetical protein